MGLEQNQDMSDDDFVQFALCVATTQCQFAQCNIGSRSSGSRLKPMRLTMEKCACVDNETRL
eukprot:1237589-Amphidinium_carterae.2